MYWKPLDYDKSGRAPLDGSSFLIATPEELLEARWANLSRHPEISVLLERPIENEGGNFWLDRWRKAYYGTEVPYWCPLPGSPDGFHLALSEQELRRESLAINSSSRKDHVTTLILTKRGWLEASYNKRDQGWISPGGRLAHPAQVQAGTVFPRPDRFPFVPRESELAPLWA